MEEMEEKWKKMDLFCAKWRQNGLVFVHFDVELMGNSGWGIV